MARVFTYIKEKERKDKRKRIENIRREKRRKEKEEKQTSGYLNSFLLPYNWCDCHLTHILHINLSY